VNQFGEATSEPKQLYPAATSEDVTKHFCQNGMGSVVAVNCHRNVLASCDIYDPDAFIVDTSLNLSTICQGANEVIDYNFTSIYLDGTNCLYLVAAETLSINLSTFKVKRYSIGPEAQSCSGPW
jgi:hypothetical protein